MPKAKTAESIIASMRSTQSHFAERYGVRKIGIFGSVARGVSRANSDLDVIVEMDAPTFDKYLDLKSELEERFGMNVDLVLAETLKKRLRPIVEREVIFV